MTGEHDEALEVLAALVYFSPSYDAAAVPFAIAHQRACALLAERKVKVSPREMRDLTDAWRISAPDKLLRYIDKVEGRVEGGDSSDNTGGVA